MLQINGCLDGKVVEVAMLPILGYYDLCMVRKIELRND